MKNNRISNKIIQFIIMIVFIFSSNSLPVLALSNQKGSDPTGKSQRFIIEKTPWYDPTDCPSVVTDAKPATGSGDLEGKKLPATEGGVATEATIDEAGKFTNDNVGEPVSFTKYAALGQEYRDYYITMRWPYTKWAWDGSSSDTNQAELDFYSKGTEPRKILVTNPENGKSIVTAALESGPAPYAGVKDGLNNQDQKTLWGQPRSDTPPGYLGRVGGLPPKAMEALGAQTWTDNGPENGGSGSKLQFSWAPDQAAKPGPVDTGTTSGSTSSTVGSVKQTGKLYLIGDSITEDSAINKGLQDNLKNSGFSEVIINSIASRSLTSGDLGSDLNGITVFLAEQSKWKDANTIVVELGTNGGLSKENIQKIMFAIQQNNPSAKVYWVNVGANNASRKEADINTDSLDKILKENSALGYKVIDWNSVVKAKPDLIYADDGLGVHPYTDAGRAAYIDTLIKGIGASGQVPSSLSGKCACKSGTGTTISGNNNKEKVYNFLISKGLTPNQAAGIMGNMEAEAGFNPKLVEYAYSDPPHESDDVPPNRNSAGQPGYGLVQWTSPGRKDGLRKRATEQNKKASDLGLQLDYFYYELFESDGYKKTGDKIKASDSLENAAEVMLKEYEIPADIPGQLPVRIGFAQKILQEFGGTTPVAGSVQTDSECQGSSESGGTIVEIAQRELLGGANVTNGGYLKYTDGNPEAWCADFASWVLKEAGTPFTGGASGGWRIPGVDSVRAYFEQNNAYHPVNTGYTPKPGDIVIYQTGSLPYPHHVNIVISVDGEKMTTIGGNESGQIKKADHESYNASYITGYGTPVTSQSTAQTNATTNTLVTN